MKLKRKSVQQLKVDAWELFSELIRRRDADWKGEATCCTCGVRKDWRRGDAGHFLSGRNNSILFDERGVNFQCKQCNGGLRVGITVPDIQNRYEEFMLKKHGKEVVDEIKRNKTQTLQFTTNQLELFIISLKDRIKNL